MSNDLLKWQAARNAELSSPESWIGLLGLFWLQSGANPVGSAPGATVVLPAGPALLGDIVWQDGALRWQPVEGNVRELQTDINGRPTVIEHENLSFFVVDRDGQLAVRLRDRNWAAHTPFAGLDFFDFDPAWRIEADWQPIEPPLLLEVPNVSGDLKQVAVAHRAVFTVAGQTVGLLPMAESESEVFFVFRDRTSGRETYGAGRFLKAKPAVDRKITLDFNFAYNPPCAFTPFATCPLPPPENWLGFEIQVGEKKPLLQK